MLRKMNPRVVEVVEEPYAEFYDDATDEWYDQCARGCGKLIAPIQSSGERYCSRHKAPEYCKCGCGGVLSNQNSSSLYYITGHRECVVYFIRYEDSDVGKIGRSALPDKRFESLQTMTPRKLKKVALIVGNYAEERKWHAENTARRLQGEWFKEFDSIVAEAFKRGAVEWTDA